MAATRNKFRLISETLSNARSTYEKGGLSVYSQFFEMAKMFARRRIGPGFYQIAGLGRTGTPFSEKRNYLGQYEFDQRLAKINPESYRKISQNKVAEKALLSAFALPTPKLLGFLNSERGRAIDGSKLKTSDDFEEFLGRHLNKKVCFKATEGWEGRGFTPVEIQRIGGRAMVRPLLEDEWLEAAEFYQDRLSCASEEWVIEEYLDQHPWFARFNPSSVNSIRLWVFQNANKTYSVLGAFLRLGREGSTVDNDTSSGRIVIPIANGVLGCGLDGLPTRHLHRTHPDSGHLIEGQAVPLWQEIQDLAICALEAFPEMRFAGIDIAVGKEQAVILELNVTPNYTGAAIMNLPLREVLLP